MLEIENLTWSAPDGEQIVKGINLTIPSDRLVAITGPNGGGKTTLAKLIAGLEKPEHRSLDSLAHPLQHEHRPEQAGRVDVVPARMHHALVPGSVFQTGLLLDRQRVHVGTQHDATAEVSPALDPGQNARSGYRLEFDARLPQAIGHITGSLPLLERQLGIGMQSPSGKQHLPGNSLRRLFDRIISFHTATIKIAFAGPTAGSATPKHQSTHPLSTGNRGARTFSSVGRPSTPTAFQRLADSSGASEPFPRQLRRIGSDHPALLPKSRTVFGKAGFR